jgi:hypothetical protein
VARSSRGCAGLPIVHAPLPLPPSLGLATQRSQRCLPHKQHGPAAGRQRNRTCSGPPAGRNSSTATDCAPYASSTSATSSATLPGTSRRLHFRLHTSPASPVSDALLDTARRHAERGRRRRQGLPAVAAEAVAAARGGDWYLQPAGIGAVAIMQRSLHDSCPLHRASCTAAELTALNRACGRMLQLFDGSDP